MITIKVDNSHAKLISSDVKAIKDIDKILSYEVQGAYFAQKVTGRGWDGRVRLMSRAGVFPTGLIHLVMKYLKDNDLEYNLVNVRSKPTPSVTYNFKLPFPPRDYQTEALEISKKRARGVFLIGTGGGKSATSAMILASKNVPTLFICPDTGLREQIAKDYRQWFGDHNVSTSINDPRPITVANIQALVGADAELFLRYGCLIIDEFHHCYLSETTVVDARKAQVKIGDIYKKFHEGKSVRVKSWNGERWEAKPVINAMRYPAPKKMLKVKVQDSDGKIKEFTVTKNHKFLTDNGKIEIGAMKVGDELVLGYTPHHEAMKKRSNNEGYRKHLSERAKKNNQTRSAEVRARQSLKIKQKIVEGSYSPFGRGKYGNGGEMTPTQKQILDMVGGVAELAIKTQDRERPYHYKVDVAIPELKIAIEIDGTSHKRRQEQDLRKDQRMGRLGWKVVRIPENSSKEQLLALKRSILLMTSSMT